MCVCVCVCVCVYVQCEEAWKDDTASILSIVKACFFPKEREENK